jgi:hypothetical protein
MQWQGVFGGSGTDSDEEPPFPKMIDGEAECLLGPFVPTEVDTIEKVLSCPVKQSLVTSSYRCMS